MHLKKQKIVDSPELKRARKGQRKPIYEPKTIDGVRFVEKYEGEWLNDKKHGKGVARYTKLRPSQQFVFYNGNWENDCWHGYDLEEVEVNTLNSKMAKGSKKSRGKSMSLAEFLKPDPNSATEGAYSATRVISTINYVENEDNTVSMEVKKIVLPTATRATLEDRDMVSENNSESKNWRSSNVDDAAVDDRNRSTKRSYFDKMRSDSKSELKECEFSRSMLRTREEIEASEQKEESNGHWKSSRARGSSTSATGAATTERQLDFSRDRLRSREEIEASERSNNWRSSRSSPTNVDNRHAVNDQPQQQQQQQQHERPRLKLLPRTKPLPIIEMRETNGNDNEELVRKNECPPIVEEGISKEEEKELSRPRLKLQPRSKPTSNGSIDSQRSSIFGKAKPIDTTRIYQERSPQSTKNEPEAPEVENPQPTLEKNQTKSPKCNKVKAEPHIDNDGFQVVTAKTSSPPKKNQTAAPATDSIADVTDQSKQDKNGDLSNRKNKFEMLSNLQD